MNVVITGGKHKSFIDVYTAVAVYCRNAALDEAAVMLDKRAIELGFERGSDVLKNAFAMDILLEEAGKIRALKEKNDRPR